MAQPRGWLALEAAGFPPAAVTDALVACDCAVRIALPPRAPWPGPVEDGTLEEPQIGADDLAYVAFTSGSTGKPKGILGRHGPLTHFLPWLREVMGFTAEDRFSLLSGLAHDPLHRDVFTPLMVGGVICIPDPDDISSPGRLAAWLRRAEVTVAHLTPAMGQLVAQPPPGEEGFTIPSLRLVILVGDVLTQRDVERLEGVSPAVKCINFYGSTETQRSVAWYPVPAGSADGDAERATGKEVLPLGRGIRDVQLVLLNAAGGLAGVGELAEIHVRSPHLARGYLGDPELTGARFLLNPFTGIPGDRLYRTGDLGRYLPDGHAEYAGRADQQVKIRGFRVELGEIEAALRRHPAVREAVVLARDGAPGGGRWLVAYVVPPRRGSAPHGSELKGFLRDLLPLYMIPAVFLSLEALPITPNGKLDRRALPAPVDGEAVAGEAPRTPVEDVVAGIWADVLGCERIGSRDDFFALGGHSLLLTRVLSRVTETFGVEVPLRTVFEVPTVEAMARTVAAMLAAGAGLPATPLRKRTEVCEPAPMSFAQERLWFLARLAPDSPFYNLPVVLQLTGPLDAAALRRTLAEVVRRHEVLRSALREQGGRRVQVPLSLPPLALPLVDISAVEEPAHSRLADALAAAEARRPFDLESPPLVRALLLRSHTAMHRLVFVMHHVATDGWSLGILVREVAALYRDFTSGRPASLPDLPVQYGDFAAWQREWLRASTLSRHLEYWTHQLDGAPPRLTLPTDFPRPLRQRFRGAAETMVLPPDLLAALQRSSRAEGVTLFMTGLAAFFVVLHRHSGMDELVVGSDVAGRNRTEVEDLIGFFINQLALRVRLAGDPAFRELVVQVREVTLAAYIHKELPFERLVEAIRPERNPSYAPIFQVKMNLHNVSIPTLELAGLSVTPVPVDRGTAQFDLVLNLIESGGALLTRLEYDLDLFRPATAVRLLTDLRLVLERAATSPELRVSALRAELEEVDRQQHLAVGRELDEASLRQLASVKRRRAEVAGG